MDITDILSAIGSVGFPIVACIAMAVFIATSFKDFNNLLTRNNLLTEELIAILRGKRDDDSGKRDDDSGEVGA